MSMRKITLKDVAEQADVSSVTVSAVLRGKSSELRISDKTRARVQETALRLGYQPNAVARALRRRYTNIIGLYSGYGYLDVRNPFLASVVGGLQKGCEDYGKDLLLHGLYRALSVTDICAKLSDGRIDGLAVFAEHDDPLIEKLAASHVPAVALVDAIPAVPSIVVDDRAGSLAIVDHLHRRGHRRLVYYPSHRFLVSADRRRSAFLEAASAYGIEVVPWTDNGAIHLKDIASLPWLQGSAAQRPSAVVCWNDLAAYEVLEQCRYHGLLVPDDLAVTGFDGVPLPGAITRQLTTIRAPWAEVGSKAVELLMSLHHQQNVPHETILPIELITGDTV